VYNFGGIRFRNPRVYSVNNNTFCDDMGTYIQVQLYLNLNLKHISKALYDLICVESAVKPTCDDMAKLAYHAKYLRMPLTYLDLLYRFGRRIGEDDYPDIIPFASRPRDVGMATS